MFWKKNTIMWRSVFIGFISACLLGWGCKGSDDEVPNPAPEDPGLIYVLNEGNFGWGESTITAYNPQTKETYQEVYNQRNGEAIGNVLQSATKLPNGIAWVVNNSGKVVITDKNLNRISSITGLRSPRMLISVRDKYVISDLYKNAVYVVDSNALSITKEVALPGWTEEMAWVDDAVWLTCPESEYVYILSANSWTLTDSVRIGMGNHSIQIDGSGFLWCRYFGEFGTGKDSAGLVKINATTKETTEVITWEKEQQLPVYLSFNTGRDTLFFMQRGDVRSLPVNNPDAVETIVRGDGRNAYAFRVEPKTGNIYYSDVLDFVTPSLIYRYDRTGELLDQFEAGIVATDFMF